MVGHLQGTRRTTRQWWYKRYRGECGKSGEVLLLQVEILTGTRPAPHNRTQAARHLVRLRPYSVVAFARASRRASLVVVVVVPSGATEPRRALAPARCTASGSACTARRGYTGPEVMAEVGVGVPVG